MHSVRPRNQLASWWATRWLELEWPEPVLRQSAHLGDYRAALDRLREMGVLYADARTRKGEAEAALSAPQGMDETAGGAAPAAWRLSLEACRKRLGARYDDLSFCEGTEERRADPGVNGDVILGRKDIGVAYHLCVVVDDARQGISHVHRGRDLYDATHTQVLLQALLGLPTPVYAHHALLLDDQGRRLAKRYQALSIRELRARGLAPSEVLSLADAEGELA